MSTQTIPIQTPTAAYPVEIGPNLLPQIPQKLAALAPKLRPFLITSPEIARLHAEPLLAAFSTRPPVLLIPPGEPHKRLPTLERLAEELAHHNADRDSVLLALGGGVLGDLTGFLAAIYMRGIPYLQLPTTALAMIDSSVGGKTGANLAAGKNLIGAFHHPLAVFADINTLRTLPAAELRAGLQEAIKAAILASPNLFEFLETNAPRILAGDPTALTHVIAASVQIKAAIVAADERESNLRMTLNLGHTLGHALEAATNYTTLLHGEAIAWGMLAALHLAELRQAIPPADAIRIRQLITSYGALQPFHATPTQLVALTAHDKKNRGATRSFILPTAIGQTQIVHNITESELLQAATQICQQATILQPA